MISPPLTAGPEACELTGLKEAELLESRNSGFRIYGRGAAAQGPGRLSMIHPHCSRARGLHCFELQLPPLENEGRKLIALLVFCHPGALRSYMAAWRQR